MSKEDQFKDKLEIESVKFARAGAYLELELLLDWWMSNPENTVY